MITGCSNNSSSGSGENGSVNSSAEKIDFENVALWSECDTEAALGAIGGVSQTILVCEKTDSGLIWQYQENEKTILAGDSCFDLNNDRPMYFDGVNFSSRLICNNGVFVNYPNFNAAEYAEVSERELKLLLKDLPENIGKKIIVFGRVFNMNPAEFQANISFKNHSDEFDYGFDDSILYAESELTKDLVKDDEFKAWVIIRPHVTYETVSGGDRTTPALRVDAIERVD